MCNIHQNKNFTLHLIIHHHYNELENSLSCTDYELEHDFLRFYSRIDDHTKKKDVCIRYFAVITLSFTQMFCWTVCFRLNWEKFLYGFQSWLKKKLYKTLTVFKVLSNKIYSNNKFFTGFSLIFLCNFHFIDWLFIFLSLYSKWYSKYLLQATL